MWWWIWVPQKEKMCSRFEWWPVVLSGFSARSCHSGERSQGSWGMTDTGGWMPASVGRSLQSTESGASRTASSLNNKTNHQWRKNILICLFYICILLSFNTLNDPICSLDLEFQFSTILFLLQLYIISIQIISNTWNAYTCICRVGKGRVMSNTGVNVYWVTWISSIVRWLYQSYHPLPCLFALYPPGILLCQG